MKATDPAGLVHHIERLVAVGDRSCGSPGSAAAAGELERAFRRLGLAVREESFRFLRCSVASSALLLDGRQLRHLPLAYAGAGAVAATALDGGIGEDDLADRPEVQGAIVLVRRDLLRHRQAQYRACVDAGAAAMVLVCTAPDDRIQDGSVREAWEGPGPIPCIAVGNETGERLLERAAGGTLRLELFVDALHAEATGRNLVATVEGPGSRRGIEVGAHYDAWGPGAVDNASGCAGLIAVAEHLIRKGPRSPVELVAFDGEELGLLGAWHRVRHRGRGPGALIDLEMPASREAMMRALAVTSALGCNEAAEASGLAACYEVAGPMASAPDLLGGYIPADVWPYYMAGLGALCTVCDTPHYHTEGDLPETVDAQALAQVAEATAEAARRLAGMSNDALVGRDVPVGRIAAAERDGTLHVEAAFAWEDGLPASDDAPVELLAFADDFRLLARLPADGLGGGRFRAVLPLDGAQGPIDLTVHRTASGESAEAHLRWKRR
ncbi:M28 family peptidase [Vulgatibacter sp.]|uniref:M28 family peptidase n=1 Tax=Vulgatibacter sp. TaxID=1971226 RepID=UPI00356A0665